MGIFLGFAPYIGFTLLSAVSPDLALWAAFAAAFVLAMRDFARTRVMRVLDVGSTLIFGLLALYHGFFQPSLSIQAVRLVVDGGLMTMALISIVAQNPFTLDYARGQVSEELWRAPLFLRTHYVTTSMWTLAFAAMTGADAAATFNSGFPLALDIGASLAALTFAVIFTVRLPARARARAAKRH